MFRFKNARCPYCGEAFVETDDIVVCPECGTPHHRNCYMQHNECANHALHSDSFQWEAPTPAADSSAETKSCPNCGKENAADNRFCNYCGSPMVDAKEPVILGVQIPSIDEEQDIDGVKIKYFKRYIGSSWEFYVYQFLIQNRFGRRISFNWSAMLFPTVFFLYRKLWAMAAIAFVVSNVTAIPLVAVQLAELGYGLFGVSVNVWSSFLPYASALSTAFCVFCALYSAWFYRRKIVKRISYLKTQASSEEELLTLIDSEAGPSKKAVLIGIVALVVLSFAIAFSIVSAIM